MNGIARNWAAIVGVCFVFALGMISGAALTARMVRTRAEQILLSGQASETITDRISHRLGARLNCDARQREELRAILQDARRDLHQARQQIAPQLRAVFGQTAGRIRGILRDDQVKTFDDMMAHARMHQGLAGLVPPPVTSPPPPETAGNPRRP